MLDQNGQLLLGLEELFLKDEYGRKRLKSENAFNVKMVAAKHNVTLHPFGHLFQMLGGFKENGFGFLLFKQAEISFRNTPHNPLGLVLL